MYVCMYVLQVTTKKIDILEPQLQVHVKTLHFYICLSYMPYNGVWATLEKNSVQDARTHDTSRSLNITHISVVHLVFESI